jgi:protein-S-isoprenylcysteine O-methyltransferase Ste14
LIESGKIFDVGHFVVFFFIISSKVIFGERRIFLKKLKFILFRIEEAILVDFFGEEYTDYKKKTPILIPFLQTLLDKYKLNDE